jgi:purine-cytosine permease-like protein
MKKINKKLLIPILFLICISFAPETILGVDFPNPLRYNTFQELLNAIINFIFTLSLWIAPIMFIMAGFYYMTAQGEPEKVKKAKDIILYTAIGLAVVFSAKGLVALFQEIFMR